MVVAEWVFRGLAMASHATMQGRRSVVASNLRRIHHGELTGAELERATKAAFASYSRYWLESFRLPGTPPAELDARLSYEGFEHLEEALARGQGAIMALPHVGGWDFGGAWFASVGGYPTMVVAEPVRPPELFDWFSRLRRAMGLEIVALGPDAGGAVLRWLRAGGVLGLLCDRDILGGGVEVDLFGERTTMPSGPATLALRTGAALLPTAVYFEGRRHHHGVVRPPIHVDPEGRFRHRVASVSQALADEFEVLIGRAPEQWHVFQPNWPSDRPQGARPAVSG